MAICLQINIKKILDTRRSIFSGRVLLEAITIDSEGNQNRGPSRIVDEGDTINFDISELAIIERNFWRKILSEYMQHVGNHEGISFLENGIKLKNLSEDQLRELQKVRLEHFTGDKCQ